MKQKLTSTHSDRKPRAKKTRATQPAPRSPAQKTRAKTGKRRAKTARVLSRAKAASQGRFFRPNAAGIDIGATEIFVAVPADRDPQPVRRKGPLGEYYRKMRARLGPAQALIATAHNLARLIYRCLKTRTPYSPEQVQADHRRAELARFNRLTKQAQRIGFVLVPKGSCRSSGRNRLKTPENEHHGNSSAATA